jgi:hypothetical protein
MSLTTLADWEQAGDDEMRWRLTMAEPPATFAVCRHCSGWLKMFRLFVWNRGPTADLEFLEAVEELRQWDPHGPMTRALYDRYVSGERDGGQKQIALSGPARAALADVFAVAPIPDRAAVFAAAHREVIDRVNEGIYCEFLRMAEGVRAGAAG